MGKVLSPLLSGSEKRDQAHGASRYLNLIKWPIGNAKRESESEVAQLCLTLCNPMDCSLPGSSFHGILQARVLEWGDIAFSRVSSRPRDRTRVSWIPGRRFNLWATREAPGSIEEYIHLNFRAITSSPPQRHHGMRVSVSFLSHGIKLT